MTTGRSSFAGTNAISPSHLAVLTFEMCKVLFAQEDHHNKANTKEIDMQVVNVLADEATVAACSHVIDVGVAKKP
jgi:hypothetical protein